MSDLSDLVDVIDRTALIENILSQVIQAFCQPSAGASIFFWNVVLDSSVMPMGSKVKVAMAIAHELDVKLEQNALHQVLSLRNAFAHHKTESHPVLVVGETESEDEMHLQLQVLSSAGKLSHKRRADALAEFNSSHALAKGSLVALLGVIKAKRPDVA